MTALSPAPWRLERGPRSAYASVIVDANGIILARIESPAWQAGELSPASALDRRNLLAMAAAPTLLEALRKVISYLTNEDDHDDMAECLARVDEAIAEAKGRTP